VKRLKNSLSVEQPIAGDELRAIKRYLATSSDKLPWLFCVGARPADDPRCSELSDCSSRGVREIEKCPSAHPASFMRLLNSGVDLRTMQDYLGHCDPKHTMHYTRVAGHRFEGLWK
jgi:integrase